MTSGLSSLVTVNIRLVIADAHKSASLVRCFVMIEKS